MKKLRLVADENGKSFIDSILESQMEWLKRDTEIRRKEIVRQVNHLRPADRQVVIAELQRLFKTTDNDS